MGRFRYDGQVFDEVDRPLTRELAVYERQAGQGIKSWTDAEQTMVLAAIAMRRRGVVLSWNDLMESSPADFDPVPDEDPVPQVPAPDAEAGESPIESVAPSSLPPADATASPTPGTATS